MCGSGGTSRRNFGKSCRSNFARCIAKKLFLRLVPLRRDTTALLRRKIAEGNVHTRPVHLYPEIHFRLRKRFSILLFSVGLLRFLTTNVAAQPGVYSGVYAFGEGGLTSASNWQAITNFVTTAGKDVSIVNNFDSWTDSSSSTNGTQSFPTTEMNKIRAHNSIPMFTWQPQNGAQGVTQSFTLANIINGYYDAYITNWATSAKNWGHPFFLRLAHEMNGDWYPWSERVNGNSAGQYVQMWQHVHDIFTRVGVTNVTWVWCVNVISSKTTPISELYPGDNYVDWISVDGYNRLANPWQDFSDVATATLTQMTNIAPGKPIMVAETGCNQNPSFDKAQWFRNVLTNFLPTVQPRIKAWVYFNSTNTSDGNDWRITAPATATVGYQDGIALPYYDTNRYGAISDSPIQPLLDDATTTDTMAPFISIVSPATNSVQGGAIANIIALASDKSGIGRIVFSINGVPQQTNTAPPYQFAWNVPASGGVIYTITATAYDNAGNSAASTIQVFSLASNAPTPPTIVSSSTNGTNLVLRIGSQTGFSYVLQTAAQLQQPNWVPLQTNVGGGLITITIPMNSPTQQFFRMAVH